MWQLGGFAFHYKRLDRRPKVDPFFWHLNLNYQYMCRACEKGFKI